MSSTKYSFSQTGFGKNPEEAMKEYGVIVNDFDNFNKRLEDSNKLYFVYIFQSAKVDEGGPVKHLHQEIFLPVIKEMKGLIDVMAFDCQHPHVALKKFGWLGVCEPDHNPEGMPNVQKIIPPELKTNPYTGKPMAKTAQQFAEGGQINIPILKDWLARDIPDFTIKVKTKEEFDLMVKSEKELDINKVILFTKKEKVTLPFKAASAELKDKIRFYIVYLPAKDPPKDLAALAEAYGATELPKLIVEQTYDNEFDKTVERTQTAYQSKSYKYRDLLDFMNKFARQTSKEESEEMLQQKEAQSTKAAADRIQTLELNPDNFEQEVTQLNDACAVYYTTLGADEDVTKEYKYFSQLSLHLAGPVKMVVFRM